MTRLLEFGLRWPGEWEHCDWWDEIVAVVETDPVGGVIHRARDPDNWKWFVPGFHEQNLTNELLAAANWQRGGGKGPKPKPAPRPWDKTRKQRKITPDSANQTDDFLKWFEGRFAQA